MACFDDLDSLLAFECINSITSLKLEECHIHGPDRDNTDTAESTETFIKMDDLKVEVFIKGYKITSELLETILNVLFESDSSKATILTIQGCKGDQMVLMGSVSSVIMCSPRMKKLNISHNALEDIHLEHLIPAICKSKSLKELNLSSNKLTDKSLLNLYKELASPPMLEILDVSFNPCKGSGVRLLEDVIADFTFICEED